MVASFPGKAVLHASLTDLHEPRSATYSLTASYFVVFEHSNDFIDEVNKLSS